MDNKNEIMDAEWQQLTERNARALEYIGRVRRSRREMSRWWDILTQKLLVAALFLFAMAVLVAWALE